MAGFRMVSPGYFGVLRQPVLRGRTFTEGDREGSPHVAIITTGIAERLWPGEDPIGKTVASNYLYDEWLTVVGLVAEASHWSMPRGEQNEIYVPWEQHRHALAGQGQIVAMIRATAGTTPLLAPVRSSLRSTLPDSPALRSVIGASVALSGVRLFEASLYGVSGADPLSYGLSVGIVVLAVLSGAWVPARRASRVDPLVAMRVDG